MIKKLINQQKSGEWNIAVDIIIVMTLFTFIGCSSMRQYRQSIGSYEQSQETSKLFKTYQHHPAYNYYYAGSMDNSDAVVGIHNDYLIEKSSGRGSTVVRWKEFEPNNQNLKKLINGMEYDRAYGATLFDHAGKQVGVLYTFKWMDWQPRVQMLKNNTIRVRPQFYVGNNHGTP